MIWGLSSGRQNPAGITPGQIVTSVVLLGVGVAAASHAHAQARRAALPTPSPEASALPSVSTVPTVPPVEVCRPFVYDANDVQREIAAYVSAGERDPSLIAVNTATRLFGRHPEGFAVTYPPSPQSRLEVKCVFDQVLAAVDQAFRLRGIEPGDPPLHLDAVTWKTVRPVASSDDLARYPWTDAVMHVEGRTMPGGFKLVSASDTDNELLKDGVAMALEMAGIDPSVAFDNSSKVGRRLRKQLRELILCSPFNDARVTSTNATYAGGREPGTHGPDDQGVTHMMGPKGRGLVWLPRHYDDLARLSRGLPAKRGVDPQGNKIGSGSSPMLVYVPAVSLDHLRGAVPVMTVEGMRWPDSGKSTLHPPTVVDRLGVDMSGVELEGGVGCEPSEAVAA